MAVPAKSSLFDPLTVEIRAAAPRDLPGIIEAWDELSALHATLDSAFERSERWQEEYRHFVRSLIGREDALVVVAVHDRELIGYGVGRISVLPGFFQLRRRGYVHDVVTRESYRKKGVGRRLAESLLAWMRDEGISTVELTVAVRNADAVAFWDRLGFVSYMHHLKRQL